MIKKTVLDIVKSKFEILKIIDFADYNERTFTLEQFEEVLASYQNYVFAPNQRILVVHHDTDYYINTTSHGFMLYNFFVLIDRYKLPQEFFIFLTNQFGILPEINELSLNLCHSPTAMKVVYTPLWSFFPNTFNDCIEDNEIENLYCCLNGVNRIHRLLTLCFLKHKGLIDRGMVSYHFSKGRINQ